MVQKRRIRWRIRSIRGGKWFRERGTKGLSSLPHVFTLLNLAFGVFSMVVAAQGNFKLAAWLVGGSLLADGIDGRVARWVKADGEFGRELDSLADVVAFGTAPAFLLYQAGLWRLGSWGLAIAGLFPICGALRLARFNIVKTSGYFVGMPITAGGTLVAALAYYTLTFTSDVALSLWIYPVATLGVAYLMVSTIPYPDFKKFKGARFRWIEWSVPLLVVVYSLLRDVRSVIMLPLVTYAVLGPWLYLLRKRAERLTSHPPVPDNGRSGG